MGIGSRDGPPGRVTRIADQFFLLGHDEFTGRPRLDAEMLGLGLAAALMAELLSEGFLHVAQDSGMVSASHVRAGAGTPSSGVTHDLLQLILTEPSTPLPTWLAFLHADGVRDKVGNRLAWERVVTARTERRRLRQVTVYPAVNPSGSQYAVTRLTSLLAPGQRVALDDVVLLCLVQDTRLSGYVGREGVRAVVVPPGWLDRLPPDHRALITHTRAAIGAASMRGR